MVDSTINRTIRYMFGMYRNEVSHQPGDGLFILKLVAT